MYDFYKQLGKLFEKVGERLVTYAKQTGFYHATPDPKHEPKKDRTRGEMIGKMEFPDIEGAEYMLSHLNNLGWCVSNGMGINALSFLEIQAYINTTETSLTAEEVLIIKRMSQAYVNEVQDKNSMKKAPFGNGSIQKSNSFARSLMAFAQEAK